MRTAAAEPGLPLTSVAAALIAIALLAFALPYVLVASLHARRLATADRQLSEVAAALRDRSVPPPARLFVGRGTAVPGDDPRWTSSATTPLSSVTIDPGPDPWGNAYQYRQPGRSGGFDVYSFGADGADGGDGDNADIGNWR